MSDGQFHSVLPRHSTGTERALERAGLWVEGNDFSHGHWNPDTCPEHLLPWLAWSLSVETFDSRWPVEIRRSIIRSSIEVHRKHGTLGGLKTALAALGVQINVTEWFDTGSSPYTFSIEARATVDLIGDNSIPLLNLELRDQVRRVIDSVKPVRAHYNLAFILNFEANRAQAAAASVRSLATGSVSSVSEVAGGAGMWRGMQATARARARPKITSAVRSIGDGGNQNPVPMGTARTRVRATMETT